MSDNHGEVGNRVADGSFSAAIPDIMRYESAIWAIADDLRGASIKESDFPAYMMPFFALMMLEGRMRNAVRKLKAEYQIAESETPDGFDELFISQQVGYNRFIVLENKTLADICRNDTTFDCDFRSYLEAFDPDLRRLLGVGRGTGEQKFLNMDGIAAELRGKRILLEIAVKWAAIDLSPYDNSSITTFEERIKRRWADISASTAGEQYTPDDIISLMAEIVSDRITKPKGEVIHLYDPTCGGANLLFGVADRLHEQGGYQHIATNGSEYNDALYALAAIESRFREFSKIEYGNTLTKVPFAGTPFDVIVANPPYGTKWSGYERDIRNDQRGQFDGGLPSVGDGQFLFMQHILWQLDSKGMAVVVADGSTLFSGDAGSGESNIRKYIFDHDWVEAIVQMPQREFFNTGITTYLWILNKNKPFTPRRNRVALIDASSLWRDMKKNKGEKSRELPAENRVAIVQALHDFAPSDICKIFDREHFYYNKQKVLLTEVDINGKHVEGRKEYDLIDLNGGDDNFYDLDSLMNLTPERARTILAELKRKDWREFEVVVAEDGLPLSLTWYSDHETISRLDTVGPGAKQGVDIGRGVITFASKRGSARGTRSITAVVAPEITTDYEIIPHHFDAAANAAEIDAFVKKYIFKPCELGENKVGVELNFNKEFYVPEKLDSVEDILTEIRQLDAELREVTL